MAIAEWAVTLLGSCSLKVVALISDSQVSAPYDLSFSPQINLGVSSEFDHDSLGRFAEEGYAPLKSSH